MSLIPSPPPDASATIRGLVNTSAQTFAGSKTFTGDEFRVTSGLGAGAADTIAQLGSSVAMAGLSPTAKLLKVSSGIGGSEVDHVSVQHPVNGIAEGVLTIDGSSVTNAPTLVLKNAGAGTTGLVFQAISTAYINVGLGGAGGLFDFYTANKGIRMMANSNAYMAGGQPHFEFLSTSRGNRPGFRWRTYNTATAGQPGFQMVTAQGADGDSALNVYSEVAAASVGAGFKFIRLVTGYGGSEVERLAVRADGRMDWSVSSTLTSAQGATAADDVVKVGTTVAGASVSATADLFSVATGIGGSEAKLIKLRRQATGAPVLYTGGGFVLGDDSTTRILFDSSGVGYVALYGRAGVSSASIATLFATDRTQPDDARITSWKNYTAEKAYMRGDGGLSLLGGALTLFMSGSPQIETTGTSNLFLKVPAAQECRFYTGATLIGRVQSTGIVTESGKSIIATAATIGTNGAGSVQTGSGGVGVSASSSPLLLTAGWGLSDVAGTSAIQLKSGTTLTAAAIATFINNATEKAKVWHNGDFESLVAGTGLIVTSPDGLTRKRIGIDNAGNVVATTP